MSGKMILTVSSLRCHRVCAGHDDVRRLKRKMLKKSAIALFVTVALTADAAAQVQGVLSEKLARLKAATILKGDPYGSTVEIAASRIAKAQLLGSGTTDCGASVVAKPVWQFLVVVPRGAVPTQDKEIRGYLVLDARTGKMECAGLPFLD